MAAGLEVAARTTSRGLVVRVTGDLTGLDTDDAALRDAAAEVPVAGLVVFDLTGIRVLTAAGVHTLLSAVTPLRADGVRCRVAVDPDSPTATVLAAAGLPAALSVLDTVDDALTREEQPAATNDVGVLATELASLTRALVNEATIGAVLHRIVTATTVIVPGADLVSVTLRGPDGAFFTPAGTDPIASALDEVQYETGAGPCVDAARLDGPAYAASDDLATEPRWPQFAAAATGHGFAAVLSTDLLAHDRPPAPGGALNIYSHRPGGISTDDRYTALLLASHAALALAHVSAAELASLQRQQLLRAVETRDVIGQAKGILMARQGLTADEAFDLLRRTSQDLNVKLVDLARTLAEHPDGLVAP